MSYQFSEERRNIKFYAKFGKNATDFSTIFTEDYGIKAMKKCFRVTKCSKIVVRMWEMNFVC